jgi:glycosyltransferase involved in cell wall biosynthesis
MKDFLVSIIMNCYNSEAYLKEAIHSVREQSYKKWEIIFWDNQSTDKSAAIAKGFKDSRIKYFYAPKHTDLGEARNLAVRKARGEWIAFLDCDDIWLSEKLNDQVDIIKKYDRGGKSLGLIYGRAIIFGNHVEEEELFLDYKNTNLPEGDIFSELVSKGNFIPLLSVLIKREAFWKVGGIDNSFNQAEDYYIFVKISEKYQVRCVQNVCCKYRIHNFNQ